MESRASDSEGEAFTLDAMDETGYYMKGNERK
jgi:hypothetical protein